MVDLIPIGTINRAPTENNAVKARQDVEETAQSNRLNDQRPPRVERRRNSNRRRGERRSMRASAWNKPERRKAIDRRGTREEEQQQKDTPTKSQSRKGRFIDERI